MKRLFFLILLVLATFLFIGCKDEEPDPTPTPDVPGDTTPTPDVPGDATPEPEPEPVFYTVTFVDENGNTLKALSVEEGTVPSYNYQKQDTAEWDYTVEGYATQQGGEPLGSLPAANADATYYAVVSKVKQTYTLTFAANGGSETESVTVEYGEQVSKPTDPTYEGHRFIGWCADVALNHAATFPITMEKDVTVYAKWNEKVDIGAYLEALLGGYELNPYSYIPESMLPAYSKNLIDPDQLADYTSSVSTGNIPYGGFGNQWHMILDNIDESMLFFNALAVVEGLVSTSVAAFNNYLDTNTADTASHSFQSGIYTVSIDFDGEKIVYLLDYTAAFPIVGEQTAQIALAMDVESGEKTVRVQLGDANALIYSIKENSYTFAIRYLGVRRAYFEIERNDEMTTGHIYEYLTVESVEVASSADFYITDEYVSAVGNKADAFLGFTGYINELYSVESGRLLGYEIREELSKIVYNTLWFNLADIDGINSIRYAENDDSSAFYINGKSTAWANKKVGGFSAQMLSRRFDIEFRTQYFYSYDAASKTYTEHAVQVPMFFVQEEYYDTLAADVKATNNVTVSVGVDSDVLAKLQEDYDTLIDVFIANKEKVTVEAILKYIGEKITV